MAEQIKLLPITEEERAALLAAIVLVLQSIAITKYKDDVTEMLVKSQASHLETVKQKLEINQ